MADAHETSGFFNSFKGDKKYTAAFFAKYFSKLVGNGVFVGGEYLKAKPKDGMTIQLTPGTGWINGYIYFLEDAPKTFEIEPPHLTLNRIDRLVMQLNLLEAERRIRTFVKRGVSASVPQPPELERNIEKYELCLADIRINAEVKEIREEHISDRRTLKDLCGIVACIIDPLDLTGIYNQYQDKLDNLTNEWGYSENVVKDLRNRVLALIGSLETQSFALINNNFEDISTKLGCDFKTKTTKLNGDIVKAVTTIYIEATGDILAERIIDVTYSEGEIQKATTTIQFNAWTRSGGTNEIISIPQAYTYTVDMSKYNTENIIESKVR